MSVPRAKHPAARVPPAPEHGSDPPPGGRRPPPLAVPRAGVSAGMFGAPAAAWLVTPLLGAMVVGAELAVVLIVVFTALFGSSEISDRAFRLLRWAWNRSEPPPGTPVRARRNAAGPGRRG